VFQIVIILWENREPPECHNVRMAYVITCRKWCG